MKICVLCEKEFKPRSNVQKFCDTCRSGVPSKKEKNLKFEEELLDPMHLKNNTR